MDMIRIEIANGMIVLNFRREVGDIRRVRHLTRAEAVALGLLMTTEAAVEVINFHATPQLSLQIINAPYEDAFLSVRDPLGKQTLVVSIQGKMIAEIGRHLLLLGQGSNTGEPSFVRRVSHCYLEDANEG